MKRLTRETATKHLATHRAPLDVWREKAGGYRRTTVPPAKSRKHRRSR